MAADLLGEDFYEGMNLFTGLETLRAPLTMQPQQWPDRPASCADEGELPTIPTHSESHQALQCSIQPPGIRSDPL